MQTRSGTPRPITRHGEQVLHRRCAEVTMFDDGLAQLVADMFAGMAAARGVGPAANQIGVDARVFVVDCPDATGAHVVAPSIPASAPAPRTTRAEACGEDRAALLKCLSIGVAR
ncbi:peptide deformylase [Paractinoplanes ovalisporus]|uniref:peptide deformylase n=1 Tax=Paractinoplanes ovalisporus TaxID=2810368 RepID=UPI0027DBDB81|nr:peptide deformylase [Actinoplanes ovalisporus]